MADGGKRPSPMQEQGVGMRATGFHWRAKGGNNRMNWQKAFQLGGVYVGTVVGAGFATGREIAEFFSKYGSFGLIGILIAEFFFIFAGMKLVQMSVRFQAKSFREMNAYLFGKTVASIIDVLLALMLTGVMGVMMAGAGSLFEEQLGLPKEAGVFLTIGLSLFVLVKGTSGLIAVNALISPALILFSFLMVLLSSQLPDFLENLKAIGERKWTVWPSGFLYASFNLMLAQAVLIPAAKEIGDEGTVKAGGWIGGIVLGAVLLSSHATLVQLPGLIHYDIPMAAMMDRLAPALSLGFTGIVYGEIFTSIIGSLYGLERFFREKTGWNPVWTGSLLLGAAYLFGMGDYGVLLSTLYPLFGSVSLLFLILLLLK